MLIYGIAFCKCRVVLIRVSHPSHGFFLKNVGKAANQTLISTCCISPASSSAGPYFIQFNKPSKRVNAPLAPPVPPGDTSRHHQQQAGSGCVNRRWPWAQHDLTALCELQTRSSVACVSIVKGSVCPGTEEVEGDDRINGLDVISHIGGSEVSVVDTKMYSIYKTA